MSTSNVNVIIGGPKKSLIYTYKSILLKNNYGFGGQVADEDAKYIIRWNFDLGGQTVTIPNNCILSFDGGIISNGTIIGQNTFIDNVGSLDSVFDNVTLQGTWRENIDNELSETSEKPVKNKVIHQAIEGIRLEMLEKGYSDNNFSDILKQKLNDLPTATELNNALNNKVTAEAGKGLSQNDFTDALKNKLDNIQANAGANVLADWTEANTNSPSYIWHKPNIPDITVQTVLANTDDPVSGRAIKSYIDNALDSLESTISNKVDEADLKQVAFSGSYNDLIDKPPVGAALVLANWAESDSNEKSFIKNKPVFATVATSGRYSDLIDAPVISLGLLNLGPYALNILDLVAGGPYLTSHLDISGKANNTLATLSAAGLMSAQDKEKLDNINDLFENLVTTDYYATSEHGGLITPAEKLKLSTIPSRGFSLDGTVSSVTINDLNKTPDNNGNVDLGNIATLDANGKVPQSQLPAMGSSLQLGEQSNQAFPGNRGKSLEDAIEALGSGNQTTGETLNTIVSLLWPNGENNEAVVATLTALLNNHEQRLKALEGDNPDFPVINYTNKFRDLIVEFNGTSPINGLLSTSPDSTIYKYLYKYYKEAEDEFRSSSSPFFLRSNFLEIEGYEDIGGLYGTYKDSYELAFDAMTAWLMAMCLSELKPSENSTPSVNPSNNQTIFFQTAFNYNGNGRAVPLYNNYHIHCDPMHARLIAGAIYAKVRGTMSSSEISAARTAIQGNSANITTYDQLDNLKCSYTTTLGSDGKYYGNEAITLGYCVDSRLIIPYAPGPYITGLENKYTKPFDLGQSSVLFYTTPQDDNWALYNYIVDYLVDKKVCEKYIMAVEHSANEADNLARVKALWGIGGTASGTYSYAKRSLMVNASVAPFALTRYFFGSRNVHLDTIDKKARDNVSYPDYYSFKFSELSLGDGQDYTVAGPFADLENKMYSSRAKNSTKDPLYSFLVSVKEAGDNARYPTYGPEYGRRRRPLGGTTNGSPRSSVYGSPLNGFNNVWLHPLFCDSNNNTEVNKYISVVGWPQDEARSYPSGHASQTMTTALMLGLLYAESDSGKLLQYVKNAYTLSVGRSITRYHWNSDIIYGRLFATMALPIINAATIVQNNYETVKSALTGSTPVSVGSAKVTYGGSSGGTINVYVQNNSASPITICRVLFRLENGSIETLARYYFNDITIPAGGTIKVVENKTIADGATGGFNYTGGAATMWDGNNVGMHNPSGNSLPGVQPLPAGTDFKNGMTYTIAYGSGTSTAVYNGGSGGTGINVTIINKTGSSISLENGVKFLVKNGETVERTDTISLGSTNPITIANDGSETFSSIAIGSNSQYTGKPFSNNYHYGSGDSARDYTSNILLYDEDHNVIATPIMESSYTFEDNATYEITLGGSSPSPTPSSNPKMTLTIVNDTQKTAAFSGRLGVYITGGDIDGHECVYMDIDGYDATKNKFSLAPGTSITKVLDMYKRDGDPILENVQLGNIVFESGSSSKTKIYIYAQAYGDLIDGVLKTDCAGVHTGFVKGYFVANNAQGSPILTNSVIITNNNSGTIHINDVVESVASAAAVTAQGEGYYTCP